MRELEARTGVGRETIRYYIRLGLLPEPERPKPNVAAYSDEHVRRVEVIKRLQQTRYLPLAFIKTLMDRRTGGEIEALPGLELRMAAGLGVDAGSAERISAVDAQALCGLSAHDLEVMVQVGVVKLTPDGGLDPVNLAIGKAWGRAKAAGYTEANGWFPEDLAIYAEAIEPMARLEVERFYTRVSGLLGVEEAAALGQVGVEAVNELLALMRTRALLAWAAELNSRIGPPSDSR